jgi:outer membrane protein assembly factor BamB
MAKPSLIFVGIRGLVVAMDRGSGTRVWETKLKGSGFVSILVDEDRVLAGTQGEIFCLDAATGKIIWHDGLRGYGLGLMSIATKNGNTGLQSLAAAEEDSSADAGFVAG